MSADDKQRLELHFHSIRDTEVAMGNMGLDVLANRHRYDDASTVTRADFACKPDAMIEKLALLNMQLVALAFACNYNRVATMQWGDGTDGTKYDVTSNASLGWTFHQISHRVAVGFGRSATNPTAEKAHHEIDVVRMKTLAPAWMRSSRAAWQATRW